MIVFLIVAILLVIEAWHVRDGFEKFCILFLAASFAIVFAAQLINLIGG